jgi:hypothetical protein
MQAFKSPGITIRNTGKQGFHFTEIIICRHAVFHVESETVKTLLITKGRSFHRGAGRGGGDRRRRKNERMNALHSRKLYASFFSRNGV